MASKSFLSAGPVATIISCRQRKTDRARTTANLESAGLRVRTFLSPCDADMPAGPEGNALVSRDALEYALAVRTSIVFCEDDIDLHTTFPMFLQSAIEAGRVTYFYQHERTPSLPARYGPDLGSRILNNQPVPPGLYPLKGPRRGTQCVYLPLDIIDILPLNELHGGAPIDVALDRWIDRLGLAALVALPNPVQHRHSRVARTPQEQNSKISLSYRLHGGET